MQFRPKQLRLDEAGLSSVLGALEADVMEAVWASGETSVRDVREVLTAKKEYSFNTIMTVMNRLVVKRLLAKRQRDGAFAYRAAVGRDEFAREVSRSVASALVAGGSLFQVSAFVEALQESSSDELRKLREIVGSKD